jgi:spore cortex formation protein SpoVR/YcgB (stage V sporulation)
VIRFLWSECVSVAEIHQRLSAQYRNSVLPQWSVYEWIEEYKNGRTSVTHEEVAGRLSTSTTDDTMEYVGDMFLLDD